MPILSSRIRSGLPSYVVIASPQTISMTCILQIKSRLRDVIANVDSDRARWLRQNSSFPAAFLNYVCAADINYGRCSVVLQVSWQPSNPYTECLLVSERGSWNCTDLARSLRTAVSSSSYKGCLAAPTLHDDEVNYTYFLLFGTHPNDLKRVPCH